MRKASKPTLRGRSRTSRRQPLRGGTSHARETMAATRDSSEVRGALADLAVQLHQRAWATQFQSLGMDSTLRLTVEARVADFSATLRGLIESGAYFEATGMFARNSDAELQFLLAAFPLMREADRATCLSDAWLRDLFGPRSIHGAGRPAVPLGTLRAMFRDAAPLGVAARDALFRGQKRTITVYRGFALRRGSAAGAARGARGLEWSTRRDAAAWFALAGQPAGFRPVLLAASAPAAAVLAFFDDRHQAECVIDATRLSAVRETRITAADRAAHTRLCEERQTETSPSPTA